MNKPAILLLTLAVGFLGTLFLQKSGAVVTFTIVSLESADGVYVAAGNHDPDGDSNGTSIVIRRP